MFSVFLESDFLHLTWEGPQSWKDSCLKLLQFAVRM